MDLSDASKLLRLSHLNKVLESLSCNEDSNAKDSIYTKSTTLDTEEPSQDPFTFFGESLISPDTPKLALDSREYTDNQIFDSSYGEFSPQDKRKHCFFFNKRDNASKKHKDLCGN